jgi:hypothetical protein
MKGWIEKNIDPPGMEKKNRGSLFSVIGKVFGIVKEDADKAFKAHFPYLADLPALRKHGKSLGIPEFPYDNEEAFRERVSAASFYLMRAGERAFVTEQLKNRFGDRYTINEKFLNIEIKILDIIHEDLAWVQNFFDDIFDPNVFFSIANWLNLIEKIQIKDSKHSTLRRKIAHSFAGIKLNGQIKLDGYTANKMVVAYGKLNGLFKLNRSLKLNGFGKTKALNNPVPLFKLSSSIRDRAEAKIISGGSYEK